MLAGQTLESSKLASRSVFLQLMYLLICWGILYLYMLFSSNYKYDVPILDIFYCREARPRCNLGAHKFSPRIHARLIWPCYSLGSCGIALQACFVYCRARQNACRLAEQPSQSTISDLKVGFEFDTLPMLKIVLESPSKTTSGNWCGLHCDWICY